MNFLNFLKKKPKCELAKEFAKIKKQHCKKQIRKSISEIQQKMNCSKIDAVGYMWTLKKEGCLYIDFEIDYKKIGEQKKCI